MNKARYTYQVTWSEEDGEYIGLFTEFPGLRWLAQSPGEALKGIRHVVTEVVMDLEVNDEPIPEPVALKQYSSKVLVRKPPGLHRRLALEAAEAGINLNRLASDKLSRMDMNNQA